LGVYRSALGDFESEKAEQFYLDVLRRMTPDQKWQAAFELWQMAVDATRAAVARVHPDWTTAQVRAEVARRIMDENGAARVLNSRHRSARAG
jgi:hypothetical protein